MEECVTTVPGTAVQQKSPLTVGPKRFRQRFQIYQSQRLNSSDNSDGSSSQTSPDPMRSFTFDEYRSGNKRAQQFCEQLLEAVHTGDATILENIIDKVMYDKQLTRSHGSSVSSSEKRMMCNIQNILHIVVAHKQKELALLLLRLNCDPNIRAMCYCNSGNCMIMGNLSTYSQRPRENRTHSSGEAVCETCTQLKLIPLTSQTALEIAVRNQSPEMIFLLESYGADVNVVDHQGNSVLMLALRENPLNWNCIIALLSSGAQIRKTNDRGICAADLSPELEQLQRNCVDDLMHTACNPENPSTPAVLDTAIIHLFATLNRIHQKSVGEDRNITTTKTQLSPKVSNASLSISSLPSGSTMTPESVSTIGPTRGIPFSQLRKLRHHREATVIDTLHQEQAWSLLKNLSSNRECIIPIMECFQKYLGQIECVDDLVDDETADKSISAIIGRILKISVGDYQNVKLSSSRCHPEKKRLHHVLIILITICHQFLEKMTSTRQFTFLSALNKIVDIGLVHGFFKRLEVSMCSSALSNRYTRVDDNDENVPSDSLETIDNLMHSSGNATAMQLELNLGVEEAFCSISPHLLIRSLKKAIEAQSSVPDGNKRSCCTPSNRLRQCWKHCNQILVARLILFLCSFKRFRNHISERAQLKELVELLDPTLDPQLLCILLQTLVIIAIKPSIHQALNEIQIDDVLIQLLLPADDWYYTNQSTKYAYFVKQHAARILVYVGLGDRVGSRVKLFRCYDSIASDIAVVADIPNENEYICQTCGTPNYKQSFDLAAVSVEGLLQKALAELKKTPSDRATEGTLFNDVWKVNNSSMSPYDPLPKKEGLDAVTSERWQDFVTRVTFQNLGEYFCLLSLILDPVLLLRLLLHKISWDLSLVVKKRPASISSSNGRKPISASQSGASSSFVRLENKNTAGRVSIEAQDKAKRRRESWTFQILGHGVKFSYEKNIRRCRSERIPRINNDMQRKWGRIVLKPRSEKSSTSSSSVRHLPKYLQNFFRNRLSTDPVKSNNKPTANTSPESIASNSEAVLEFARTLQNYPLARRVAMRYQRPEECVEPSEQAVSEAGESGNASVPDIDVFDNMPGSPDWNPLEPATNNRRLSMEFCINAALNPLGTSETTFQGLPGLPMIEIQRPSIMLQTGNLPFSKRLNSSDSANMYLHTGNVLSGPSSRNSSFHSVCQGSLERRLHGNQGSFTTISRRSSQCSSQRNSTRTDRTSVTSEATSLLFPYHRGSLRQRRSINAPLVKTFVSRHQSALSLDSAEKNEENPIPIPVMEFYPDFQCIHKLVQLLLIRQRKPNPNTVSALKECAHVLRQILNSPQHPIVKTWCLEIIKIVSACVEPVEESAVETEERINDEYLELQDQVVCSSIPTAKEDAALLASIQLCIEENWPKNKRTQKFRRHFLRGQIGMRVLKAILRDELKFLATQHNAPCRLDATAHRTRVRTAVINSPAGRAACGPNCLDFTGKSNNKSSVFPLPCLDTTQPLLLYAATRCPGIIRELAQKIMVTPWETDHTLYCAPPTQQENEPLTGLKKRDFPGLSERARTTKFMKCINDSSAFLSAELQEQCLPVEYRGDRRTLRLLQDRKRKLFHSQIYENEMSMKKLYIQTVKKLPAYNCKVFQVKELIHGRTLRKSVRLLCLSSTALYLLDDSTKLVLKRQHTSTLQQWRIGGGISRHQILLEFRGTKWQLIASSYTAVKSISMTLWEMMQNSAGSSVRRSFLTADGYQYDASATDMASASSRSNSSAAHGFIVGDEPITLYRSELERLQYILHFPEEVAFQLSATEYQLFYAMQPMDYVRYVSCDLTSVPVADNMSPVRNLVKRLSEISSWITHVIVSMPTHEDRKTTLTLIIRVIDTCWNIGNFNAAVEILMGLKSERLRPFWLSLKLEEKTKYEKLCEILLPSSQAALSKPYREAIQRALHMPQCRLIPFFGVFLRDLYAIVNDIPNVVMIGSEDDKDKLEFLKEQEGDDHYTSKIGVGGLLNADKINLVAVVLDNLELFYRHYKNVPNYVVDRNRPSTGKENREPKGYEPVQPIQGVSRNVTVVPLDTNRFDLDVIQRLHHGTTVIHFDPDTGRSAFCLLKLDASCGLLSWHRIGYLGSKESKDKEVHTPSAVRMSNPNLQSVTPMESRNPTSSPCSRPVGAAHTALDDGFIRLYYVKSVESVDSYDIDIESVYRRHSNEEMSVPMLCWTINFGCHLSDNEFLYFIAPQQTAQYWLIGLTTLINYLLEQQKCADRRVLWLRKLYLRLWNDCEQQNRSVGDEGTEFGPRPYEALQAFGGRVERWKSLGLQNDPSTSRHSGSVSSIEAIATKSRFKQMTNAVTRRMKAASRSQSPQPFATLKASYSSVRSHMRGQQQSAASGPSTPKEVLKSCDSISSTDTASLRSWYTSRTQSVRAGKTKKPKNHEIGSPSSVNGSEFSMPSKSSDREYQEKPVTLFEFIELYQLFSTKMRKDLKDVFNECLVMCGGNSNAFKRDRERQRKFSQSDPSPPSSSNEFIPNDVLTRNGFTATQHISDKQQKIYNALALASVNSTGLMDTSRSSFLTPAMLKQFIAIHQMEIVDEDYALKLIQTHEPDPACRNKQQLSFEGFVRYLTDSMNYAFVPEAIKPDPGTLHFPLSYYYICSSHNTYLTGHQLKGESSTEMYRQVLLTGCRCVELDCWDGDDGLPQIFHGHTLTSKIGFRQVLNVIKKSAFITSSLPVVLSIENHCSLQQQARMAQMFKNYLGENLVTNFLFEADYSDCPQLPSPWQLQNKILIKNKKLVAEPSTGLQLDKCVTRSEGDTTLEQSNGLYGTDEDDLDEFEDDLDDDEVDDRTDSESPRPLTKRLSKGGGQHDSSSETEDHTLRPSSHATSAVFDLKMDDESVTATPEAPLQRPIKKAPGAPLAPELSDLVIYAQAVKFKGFPATIEPVRRRDESPKSMMLGAIRNRAGSNLLSIATPPRRLRSAALLSGDSKFKSGEEFRFSSSSSLRANSHAPCYQVTSLNEPSARKLSRKHPLKCIAYSRDQIVRTYPSGMRIDSSNFNPVQYWAFGLQMVALNFQTADTAMAVNVAMFEQTGNCGCILKPRVFWDDSHPYYNRFNPLCKDTALQPAIIYTITIISGQHICPNQHAASPYVELEIIGIPADCTKEKSKIVSRNSVNPIWNHTSTFRIVFVELAFLRIAIYDNANGRCMAQRVVPVQCIRPGYRHLPLRTPANVPMDQGTVFLYSRFEQEEHIYLHDEDDATNCNFDQELHPQMLTIDSGAKIKAVPILKRQIFILRISGLYADDTPVIVRAESSSTVKNVIQAALTNVGKNADTAEDYVLVEVCPNQFGSGEEKQQHEQFGHRILPPNEPVMDSVACWNGSMRRFVIRKKGTDPSSRAWISSIIKSGVGTPSTSSSSQSPSYVVSPVERRGNNGSFTQQHPTVLSKRSLDPDAAVEKNAAGDSHSCMRTVGGTFLVCIHNVSAEQPYVILRASIKSTASDIIKQVFLKLRRMDADISEYVLLEETAKEASSSITRLHQPSANLQVNSRNTASSRKKSVEAFPAVSEGKNVSVRVLRVDENVWKAQSAWKTPGRFLLENRKDTVHSTMEKVRDFLQALENARLSAGLPSST